MHCGDIVFTSDNNVYIVYDKQLLIGASILGIKVVSLKQLYLGNNNLEIYRSIYDIDYRKKKKMFEHLASLMYKKSTLSLKERMNFLKYIFILYRDLFKIDLTEHHTVKITSENIKASTNLKRITYDITDSQKDI